MNDLDAIGIPLLHRTNFGFADAQARNTDQYSQEFTFTGSAFDEKLDYTFGVFGFYEETDAGTAIIQKGFDFNNTPEWTGNLSADYRIPVAASHDLRFHVDYIYKGEQANDAENTPELFSDDVSLFNASVSFGPDSDNWKLVVGGKNLTDERYIVSGFRQPRCGRLVVASNFH